VVPHLPRRNTQVQLLESLLVLEGVHTLPEAAVLVSQQGLLLNQSLKGLSNQLLAGLDTAEIAPTHHEEAAVDPNVTAAQWANVSDCSSGPSIDDVKTRGRLHQKQGGDGAALPKCHRSGTTWVLWIAEYSQEASSSPSPYCSRLSGW